MEHKHIQAAMAKYLRDPDGVPTPEGIEERRLKIYRELIFNNIEGFISGGFPVLRELYDDQSWSKLIRQFIKHHQSHSPYFLQISEEFLQFLQNEFVASEADPAFLLELAHYEWVELALDVSSEVLPSNAVPVAEIDDIPAETLLNLQFGLSPLAWPLSYQFPVHQISVDNQPSAASELPTFIVAYRQDENVKFLEVNGATVRLLTLMSENTNNKLGELLEILAEELQQALSAEFIDFGIKLVIDMLHKKIAFINRRNDT